MNILSAAEFHACVHGPSPCFLSAFPLHPFARRTSLQYREAFQALTVRRPRCGLAAASTAVASSMQQAELTNLGKSQMLLHEHRDIVVASTPPILLICYAEGLSSSSSPEPSMSKSELRSLWDRVGKPLLRVGKSGVQVHCC